MVGDVLWVPPVPSRWREGTVYDLRPKVRDKKIPAQSGDDDEGVSELPRKLPDFEYISLEKFDSNRPTTIEFSQDHLPAPPDDDGPGPSDPPLPRAAP